MLEIVVLFDSSFHSFLKMYLFVMLNCGSGAPAGFSPSPVSAGGYWGFSEEVSGQSFIFHCERMNPSGPFYKRPLSL